MGFLTQERGVAGGACAGAGLSRECCSLGAESRRGDAHGENRERQGDAFVRRDMANVSAAAIAHIVPNCSGAIGESAAFSSVAQASQEAGAIKIPGFPARCESISLELPPGEGFDWIMEVEAPRVALAKLSDSVAVPL